MPLVPKLLRPSVILRRNATYKGLLGGQKGWLAVGVVMWSKSLLKKLFGKTEEIIATEKLTKGQSLRIDAVKPLSRRQRKRTERSEKQSIAAAKASAKLTAAAAKAAKAEVKAKAKARRSAARHST